MGYFFGGAIPLLPYILAGQDGTVTTAFWWSCCVMMVALFTFGTVKTRLLLEEPRKWEEEHSPLPLDAEKSSYGSSKCIKGGIEMVVLGGIAAGAAIGSVKLVA